MITDGKELSSECAICLNNVSNEFGQLKCKHIFCFQCIENWSKHENTCPLCKTRFTFIDKVDMNADTSQDPKKSKKRKSSTTVPKAKKVKVKKRDQSEYRSSNGNAGFHAFVEGMLAINRIFAFDNVVHGGSSAANEMFNLLYSDIGHPNVNQHQPQIPPTTRDNPIVLIDEAERLSNGTTSSSSSIPSHRERRLRNHEPIDLTNESQEHRLLNSYSGAYLIDTDDEDDEDYNTDTERHIILDEFDYDIVDESNDGDEDEEDEDESLGMYTRNICSFTDSSSDDSECGDSESEDSEEENIIYIPPTVIQNNPKPKRSKKPKLLRSNSVNAINPPDDAKSIKRFTRSRIITTNSNSSNKRDAAMGKIKASKKDKTVRIKDKPIRFSKNSSSNDNDNNKASVEKDGDHTTDENENDSALGNHKKFSKLRKSSKKSNSDEPSNDGCVLQTSKKIKKSNK